MTSSRYLNYNTQLIDPDVDPGQSLEFLELSDINLIEKIPYEDEVDLFYKDKDNNVLHGKFVLGQNEKYEGSAKVITYQIFQEIDEIYARSSYYKPGQYFYFFYNNNDNIYVRSFKINQGTLGDEILVRENAKIESVTRSSECYFFVFEDLSNSDLLKKAKGSSLNGELKLMFVFENDITEYEQGIDQTLAIQEFGNPFRDITEQFYSSPNELEHDNVPLYMSSSNAYLEQQEEALNGLACKNYGKMVTRMDHQDDFSIIARVRPSPFREQGHTIFSTDNFSIQFFYDFTRLTLSNGYSHDFNKSVPDISGAGFGYHTFVLSAAKVNNKYVFNFGEATSKYEKADYTLESHVYESGEFSINETCFVMENSEGVDYLAIKNDAMTLNTIDDMLVAINDDFYKKFISENNCFDAEDIESDRFYKIEEIRSRSIHPIPDNYTEVNGDFTGITNDEVYVVNAHSTLTTDRSVYEAEVYVKEDGAFNNINVEDGIVYIKSGGYLDANHKAILVYYEQGANMINIQNCNLIPTSGLFFEDEPQLPLEYSSYVDEAASHPTDYQAFINYSVSGGTEVGIPSGGYNNNLSPFNFDVSLTVGLDGFDTSVAQLSGECLADLIPTKRFIDLGNDTMLDMEQNVIWSKTPIYVTQSVQEEDYDDFEEKDLVYEKKLDNRFTVANFEVENLVSSDEFDWRMPTELEMRSITRYITSSVVGARSTPAWHRTRIGETVGGNPVYGYTAAWQGGISSPNTAGNPSYDTYDDVSHTNMTTSANQFNIYSDVFNTEEYNNTDVSDRGNVKNDYVWVENGKIVNATNGNVVATDDIKGAPATLMFPVRKVDPEWGIFVKYSDGTKQQLPKKKGDKVYLNKRGFFTFEKSHYDLEIHQYDICFSKRQYFNLARDIDYIEHERTNSNNRYFFGTEVFIDRKSSTKEAGKTVFPLKLQERFDFHRHLLEDAESNIRLCEHQKQRDDMVPFKIEHDVNVQDIVVWAPLDRFQDKVGFQYSLVEQNLLNNPYDDYNVLSKNVYSQDEYYSAFHFGEITRENQKLITEIEVDDNGEIMLLGRTKSNTYAREIESMKFFGVPDRYKSSNIILEVDVEDRNLTQSYINNYKDLRRFLLLAIEQWKPANVILEDIIEKETLVMAKLLQDEYVQVLVGITPLDNFNAYYNRTVDNREVVLKGSSDVSDDQINWIGIPQANNNIVKSGITKVINEKKQIKVSFETRYENSNYRAMVFAPYDAKFFVVQKDRDGFVVESSSTIREEISWITTSSREIVNGTIRWKRGVPNGDEIVDHYDRISEISKNSNVYTLDFTSLGFPEFDDASYSVILCPNKNVNVWVDTKTTKSFTIRRSYVGDDLDIDYFVVRGNSKWWEGITT